MSNISVQLRRGTDTEHSSFTGAEGEVTVDTTNDTLRVHDGTTAGGIRLAKLSEAGGTVTSVGSGTGLTGGPITTSGTLSLANTAVTAGSYTNTNLTVDAQGRITAASNGTSGAAGTPNWNSGWFNDTTGLSNGGTYTFTHNLGTENLIVQVYMATSSSGADLKSVEIFREAGDYGGMISNITSTQVEIQLGTSGWAYFSGSGLITTGNWGTTYDYIKVVASASATVGAVSKYESGETALPNADVTQTWAHGLGQTPDIIKLILKCTAAEHGYSIGDEVHFTSEHTVNVSASSFWADSSNVSLRYKIDTGASAFWIVRRDTTGLSTPLTPSNWRIIVRAFAF